MLGNIPTELQALTLCVLLVYISSAAASDKDIPYIFISNAQDDYSIKQANKLSIQGYIHKGTDYNKYKEKIRNLVDYWKENINTFSSKSS